MDELAGAGGDSRVGDAICPSGVQQRLEGVSLHVCWEPMAWWAPTASTRPTLLAIQVASASGEARFDGCRAVRRERRLTKVQRPGMLHLQ